MQKIIIANDLRIISDVCSISYFMRLCDELIFQFRYRSKLSSYEQSSLSAIAIRYDLLLYKISEVNFTREGSTAVYLYTKYWLAR